MADPPTVPDPTPTTPRPALRPRLAWLGRLTVRMPSMPGGLSARLLLLTAVFVALAELLILWPALASFEEGWLLDRVRAAELASLAVEAAPAGVVSDQLAGELLEGAGVVSVAIQSNGVRRLLLAAPRFPSPPELVDLRQPNIAQRLAAPFAALPKGDRMLRVVAVPRFRSGDFVEIVVPNRPLRADLLAYMLRLLGVTAFVVAVAGAVLYFSLAEFLVRPIRRITRSMERFRIQPEDPDAVLRLSGRRDEIGRAESELARMQDELRAALLSKARLAALGEAVAKINHDLKNMLTSAQLASERMAGSGDPQVAQALPRLERALDRAVRLAQGVLDYGKSEEPEANPVALNLHDAAEAAGQDAGLFPDGVRLELKLARTLTVMADPEQLHRILVNLFRNARQAAEAAPAKKAYRVKVEAKPEGRAARILIADNGPGLPERAREKLFQPFAGSSRPGGAGLGLAIARELARAQGGELELFSSNETGACFELRLPLASR
jgi:signal transduction histidine kinase